ncbi:MAG: biotin carboxylase N-terminal domain-containing protein [Alphaproteobacteria bacterium]|jgi:3-methylcrotonyl-CoA carboxylase alpha subunit|nr:biotin carboxylase N-terminal domain-containing protein [Alphaproteobacteria bacterium]
MTGISKLLIANRGDSAIRIARTCRRLGLAMAGVHSESDARAAHVRAMPESVAIGPAPAAESYLDIDAILGAARAVSADAVHPGIGFLSESAEFAAAVEKAGLVFVGPRPETLATFADKLAAKAEARAAGLPVLDGDTDASADPAALVAMVRALPLPVALKAVAGGGGRSIRRLASEDGLEEQIASALREAESAFGRPELLVERFLPQARHLEVQLLGDGDGHVVHLYDRECSLQRRYQKIVEEAPVAGVPEPVREAIWAAACRLGERTRLRGLATVEFLYDGEDFFFLEVNPRLQVEHTVTEEVTGLDLVELQLRVAKGAQLGLAQDQVAIIGHAIQARLYAEDPENDFLPTSGVVHRIDFPANDVRVDAAISAGETVGHHYDPLLAKLIAAGADRGPALHRLRAALGQSAILGLETNLAFLRGIVGHADVISGDVDTGWIDRHITALPRQADSVGALAFAMAGCLWLRGQRQREESDPWQSWSGFTGWRLGRAEPRPTRKPSLTVRIGPELAEIAFAPIAADGRLVVAVNGECLALTVEEQAAGAYLVETDTKVIAVRSLGDGDAIYLDGPFGSLTARVARFVDEAAAVGGAVEGRLLAPVMGQVTKINVGVGDRVSAGDILIVQESMKMELRLAAPCDGVVAALACAEGDMVERHGLLAEVHHQEIPETPG